MLITSFTQTYGDKRILELELLRYDQVGSYFRNKCDYIIFSFHNCPKEFINRGKLILHSLYSKEKLIILEYSDCSYLESMRATLTKIKEKNIDYVLQIQDDQHGLNNFENINNFSSIDSIFSFLNKNSPDYLHIFESEGDKKHNKLTPVEETLLGEVVFYKYKSTDFKNANIFSWNTY